MIRAKYRTEGHRIVNVGADDVHTAAPAAFRAVRQRRIVAGLVVLS
jgi:hypothetical protein